MGFFRVSNGKITIDDGADSITFEVADVEKCVPWIPGLPENMLYTQGTSKSLRKIDAAINSIEKIRDVLADEYRGLEISYARDKRKTELIEEIKDMMLEPKRLFTVILPAISGESKAINQIEAMLTKVKNAYLAAAVAIDSALTIADVKAVELEIE